MGIDRLILTQVLEPQHALVRACLDCGIFSVDDIQNLYKGDGGKPATVTAQWYLVTEWFADWLVANELPVLRNEFGSWWGYTGEEPLVTAALK